MRSKEFLDVIGVGAPILDQIIFVTDEELAKIPGKKGGMELVDYETFLNLLNSSNFTPLLTPGGSCANTIRGLAQLEHKCGLIGKIGNDLTGQYYLDQLKGLHIHPFLTKSATPTGQVLCFVTPDGIRTCRTFLGASQEMTAEDLDPSEFHQVRLVHLEGYTLLYPDLAQRTMEYAKNAGALISMDLGSFEIVSTFKNHLIDLLQKYVDICFANGDEIQALAQTSSKEGCAFLKEYCSIAVVLMGAYGAWVGHKDTLIHCPAYTIEHPLDTTGAGDLFASGFLHGFLTGKSIETCGDYGALAGSAVVQIQGAALSSNQWQQLRAQISNRQNKTTR